jgi:thiamine-monophosphate kinase
MASRERPKGRAGGAPRDAVPPDAIPGAAARRGSRPRSAPPNGAIPQRALGSRGREWATISALQALLAEVPAAATATRTVFGIGDDAAVLETPRGARLVWTVDACLEGVHFRSDWLSFADVGWRATQAAVSDVAAMGARPVAALCHLTLPSTVTPAELRKIGQGQAEASRALGCPVIGGNVASGAQLEVVTTVLGEVPGGASALERAGARAGDEVWLLGDVGRAAAGLRCLELGLPARGTLRSCVEAWRRPQAQVAAGLELQGRAHACLDVSDGLAGDAAHLADASGVSIVFEAARIDALARPLLAFEARLERTARELVLWGGEDYALLAAGPAARRPSAALVLGRCESGAGVWLDEGTRRKRLTGGFQHLTAPRPTR